MPSLSIGPVVTELFQQAAKFVLPLNDSKISHRFAKHFSDLNGKTNAVHVTLDDCGGVSYL